MNNRRINAVMSDKKLGKTKNKQEFHTMIVFVCLCNNREK